MSQSPLDEIRRQLESLDEKIHDLLIKRAEVAGRLADLQRKANAEVLQPDGEAALIRRLLARHSGIMPREAVARIWREVCATVLMTQKTRKVAVTAPDSPFGLISWDMAKDYFGSVVPLQKVANPLAALSLVKEKDAAFGVLPWPEDDAPQPWWRFLLDEAGDKPMKIVARLPLGEYKSDNGNPEHKALVVARLPVAAKAEDRTFIVMQLEQRISRARIVDKARMLGMTALSMNSTKSAAPDYTDHLLEVTGYADEKLPQLLKALESEYGKAVFAGGYPVPPLYDEQPTSTATVAAIKKSA